MVGLQEPDDSRVRAVRGRVRGLSVIAYCTDGSRMGGALGAAGAQHIIDAIDTAVREECPVVGIWHSGGAALAEGVQSMDGVGRMFAAMTRASGVVPQISVVLGPAAGAAAYGPALTDIVIMSKSGRMFVTGPDVVRQVTGEQTDMDSLGGPDTHGPKSGVAHIVVDSDAEAVAEAAHLTELFGRPGRFQPQTVRDGDNLRALLPETSRRAYDVRPLVRAILDDVQGRPAFTELQPKWAANVVIGLGRLADRTVGVIANNPLRKGGCLDSLSAEKAARFVRMCDSLGVPLVVIVDVPGYLPGVGQELGGVIRRGAKLLHVFASAVVPRVTLVTRKSYGGAYIAMNSRALGADAVFAWPESEVAVMGAEAAVDIIHRRSLAAAAEDERVDLHTRLVAEHRLGAGGLDRALALGVIDEVIHPAQTRRRLAEALGAAPPARGTKGNVPL
ncbi:carboxyl transferase domain-containing protein [Plantactinospora sp. ZYX-F-223]|uniref:acyl-CoA carboxylase subunit beta n=1 Tax=Plantactinospora sp. ZYX-F-223 TaxID=3144103 RepID=UPI0031FC17BF